MVFTAMRSETTLWTLFEVNKIIMTDNGYAWNLTKILRVCSAIT